MTIAVTFDAGQTLLQLDAGMLAARLAERDVTVAPAAIERAQPAAWQAYNAVVGAPDDAPAHPWQMFMRALIRGAAPDVQDVVVDELAAWLFDEQPRHNLWRRQMPGMIELVDELRAAGVTVAIVSNSEGRLAELLEEIGLADRFAAVADSGKLEIEKPDRRIFDWTAAQLGVATERFIHVGDSWAADIVGARNAGARAIWFGPATTPQASDDVVAAVDAAAVRAALVAWHVLPPRR